MLRLLIVSLGVVALATAACNDDTPAEVRQHPLQWTGASFLWPCPSTQSIYKNSGRAINKNVIATRAQVYGDQVFIAMPRFRLVSSNFHQTKYIIT